MKGVGGCQHDWEPVTVDLYHCLRCRAKRWWKADHHRGDIALGEVTKNYEVRKCGDGRDALWPSASA